MTERSDSEIHRHIGAQITAWREIRGMQVKDLGERIGVASSNLLKLERGEFGVSLGRLKLISEVLGVPMGGIADASLQVVPVLGELPDGSLGELWTREKADCLVMSRQGGRVHRAFKTGVQSWLLCDMPSADPVMGQRYVLHVNLAINAPQVLMLCQLRDYPVGEDRIAARRLALLMMGAREPEGGFNPGRGLFTLPGTPTEALMHPDDARIIDMCRVVGRLELPEAGDDNLEKALRDG